MIKWENGWMVWLFEFEKFLCALTSLHAIYSMDYIAIVAAMASIV